MAATSPAVKNLFSGGARKSENIMGTYAHFGDAYRQAHHELVQSGEMPKDSHPHALQAATWLHWRDMTVKGQKFYASDHDKFPEHSGVGYQREKQKRQRQVAAFIASKDHDPGERIDPAGGPPEEEDPDLRQTEWNPYDPFKEGEDEDDEGEDGDEDDEDEENDPKHPKPPRHLRLASFLPKTAVNADDEVPPKLGESPIPEGTIRVFHNTWGHHIPSIREHGLLENQARGDSGKGAGHEESAGVWVATGHPAGDDKMQGPRADGDRHVIEGYVHPHQISDRAESPWSDNPHEWGRKYHHSILNGDLPKSQIVAIHAPWHQVYRELKSEPD